MRWWFYCQALLVSAVSMAAQSGIAYADPSIIGTWKVLSYVSRDEETGEEAKPWGDKPSGYLIYTASGYMSAVGHAEGRTPPTSAEDRVKLYSGLTAYSGKYTRTPEGVIHHVEVAWNPAWIGTDQVRYVRFDDDNTMQITTPPVKSTVDGRKRTYTLQFKRSD